MNEGDNIILNLSIKMAPDESMEMGVYFPSVRLSQIVARYEYIHIPFLDGGGHSFLLHPSFDNGILYLKDGKGRIKVKNESINNEALPGDVIIPVLTTPAYNLNFHGVTGLRILFRPGVFSSLYQLPLDRFSKALAGLGQVDKYSVDLFDLLFEVDTPLEMVSVVECYLLRRLSVIDHKQGSISSWSRICNGLNYLLNRHGYTKSINEMSAMLGYTPWTLRRTLKKTMGVSIREFHRIHRFERIANHLQSFPKLSLTQMAYAYGYADQAHFTRSFKRLAKQTPGEFLKSMGKNPMIHESIYML